MLIAFDAVVKNILTFSGLQLQNTTLAVENRKIKQELAKAMDTARRELQLQEAVEDYKSQIEYLKQQNEEITKEKEGVSERLNNAVMRLNQGKEWTWRVTDYMHPNDLPLEAANYIDIMLEEKRLSEEHVYRLQEELKRLSKIAYNSEHEIEKQELLSAKDKVERELQCLNEDFKNVKVHYDALSIEHEKCEKVQKEHEKEMTRLKIRHGEDLKEAMAKQTKYVEDLKKSHEEDVQSLNKLVEKLEKELKEAPGTVHELAIAKETIKSLKSKVNELEIDLWDFPETAKELAKVKQTNAETLKELANAKEKIDYLEGKVVNLLDEIDYGHEMYGEKVAKLACQVKELEGALTSEVYKEVELLKTTYENKIDLLENQLHEVQCAEAAGIQLFT